MTNEVTMHNKLNLRDEITLVPTHDTIHALLIAEPLIAEPSSGYTFPDADAYARRLADEAEGWLQHARQRSRMKDETLVRKVLQSLAFSLRWRTNHVCVPSKLVGTSKHQPALWAMVRGNVGFGTRLDVEEIAEGKRARLLVSYGGERLGEVAAKSVGWMRPLTRPPFQAALFLIGVSGQESTYTLGLSYFTSSGAAVTALRHALGQDLGGDGHGGDGAAPAPTGAARAESQPRPDHGGDGAAGALRLVSSAPSVAKPEAATPADPDDVVLYRDIHGVAHATVEHAVRHSPTGIEWGYHGSGPADLARSVLLAFTGEATAERLYQRFKEVVAAVPKAGGVIRAEGVRAWLTAQQEL